MKAFLLAAGFGTRFKPHTEQAPKPALPFLNVPLGFHCFAFLKAAGVKSLVVNTHHLPEKIISTYNSQKQFTVEYSPEPGVILGSSGGLKKAESFLKNEKTILMLNADEVIFSSSRDIISDLLNTHESQKNLATLLVMEHKDVGTQFGGVWVNAKNQVIGFGKTKPPGADLGYHFIGAQAINPSLLSKIPINIEQNIFYDTLSSEIKLGEKIGIHKISCQWFETGNLQDYLKATKSALELLEEKSPMTTATRDLLIEYAPNSGWLKDYGRWVWGDRSCHLSKCKVSGFAVLGSHVQLSSCEIENAVLTNGVHRSNQNIQNDLILV